MLPLRFALLVAMFLTIAACGDTASDGATAVTTLPPTTTTTVPPVTTATEPPPTMVPESISVPNLSGLTLTEARALLGDAGLGVRALPDDIREGIVVAQEPSPGTEVEEDATVVVDVQQIPTCNPPDPTAPDSGQAIITVFFECGNDSIVPTPGVGVARIVPEPEETVDRIEWTLRSLLAGPTADEQVVGIESAFDAATADALNGVTLTGGRVVADFNDTIVVNNMSTSTGMIFFNAELKRNVFQHPEVDSVEFRFDGDCAAWSALFESDGCWVVSRADWEEELAAWDEARDK